MFDTTPSKSAGNNTVVAPERLTTLTSEQFAEESRKIVLALKSWAATHSEIGRRIQEISQKSQKSSPEERARLVKELSAANSELIQLSHQYRDELAPFKYFADIKTKTRDPFKVNREEVLDVLDKAIEALTKLIKRTRDDTKNFVKGPPNPSEEFSESPGGEPEITDLVVWVSDIVLMQMELNRSIMLTLKICIQNL